MILAPESFEASQRPEQRGPLVVVERRSHHGQIGQQQVVLDVQDACGHVGAFEERAEQIEPPPFAAHHRVGRDAVEARDPVAHLGIDGGGAFGQQRRLQLAVHLQPQLIQRFPHLFRDAIAHHAGVLARQAQAGADGVGVGALLGHELDHLVRRDLRPGVALRERVFAAADAEQRPPLRRRWQRILGFEEVEQVDLDQPRRVAGTFESTVTSNTANQRSGLAQLPTLNLRLT